jgi:hypothetical protein
MKRATRMYGILLVMLLGAAWVQWTAEAPVDLEGKVVVLQGEADAITEVRWISEDNEATVRRQSDAHGNYYWVDYTRWKETKLPSARSAEDTGEAEAEIERVATRSAFKGSEKAKALMDSLSPLAARRRLTISDDGKLEQLGLLTPGSRIEIDRAGSTEVLEIGAESYGTRDYYVRHVGTDQFYLFERDLIQPLKYARTRLPDRRLSGLEPADLRSATLTVGEDAQTWTQVHGEDQRKAHWVHPDSPDTVAEQATTWLDKFLKLKGTKFADPDQPPADLQERFVVALSTERERTTVTVSQVGSEGDWYAVSEHTRGLIKLVRSGATGLADDVSGLMVASE